MFYRIFTALLGVAAFATALSALPQQAHAAGKLKFCANWYYQFSDEGNGEDKLLHLSGKSYGRRTASYSYAKITRDGVEVWKGHTDSNGCTDQIDAPSGTYVESRTASLGRGSKKIYIKTTDSSGWKWFSRTIPLGSGVSNGSVVTYTTSYGYGEPTASVAATMTEVLARDDIGVANVTYNIYADQDCPSGGFAGCYNGSVYLGDDNNSALEAFNKTVTLHEMGHYVQSKLFGSLDNDYTFNINRAECRCDHVKTANALHCLQSLEHNSAAQVEGWAQFFAADVLNNNNEMRGVLPYYKEFLYGGNVMSPPVAIWLGATFSWADTYCKVPYTATELDWSNFYWLINNTGSYTFSYADFEDAYEDVCGGTCARDNVSWWDLRRSVESIHGYSSGKASRFRDTGRLTGVDN